MLYNNELKKVQKPIDCMICQWFDKDKKKCGGVGKACFEYDPKTHTCLDPKTKLPIKLK